MLARFQYELLERVALGQHSEVFQARSVGPNGFQKVLAVKRALKNSDEFYVRELARRGNLGLRLSHANIVQTFDVGKLDVNGDCRVFCAVEFVRGVSLEELILALTKKQIVSPSNVVAFVALEVGKALDYAHRRRDLRNHAMPVPHGNLVASKVMLSREGEVKVRDFGAQSGALDKELRLADLRALGSLLSRLLVAVDAFSDETSLSAVELCDRTARALVQTPEAYLNDLHEVLLECAYAFPRRPRMNELAGLVKLLLPDQNEGGPSSVRTPPAPEVLPGPDDALTKTSEPVPPLFVGRRHELKKLSTPFEAALRGGCQLILIEGPAGTGKTAFLEEVSKRLKRDGRASVVLVTCSKEEQSTTLAGLRSTLNQRGHSDLSDAEAITNAFSACAHALPTEPLPIFVWDRAEYLDDHSLDLILKALGEERRAMFIVSTRSFPERIAALPERFTHLVMREFGDEEVALLLAKELGTNVVKDALVQKCLAETQGHPARVIEFVRTMD